MSRLIAPVEPEPTGITTSSCDAPTYAADLRGGALVVARVISRPVALLSVCVFAMKGSTRSLSSSSTSRWKRPEAMKSK